MKRFLKVSALIVAMLMLFSIVFTGCADGDTVTTTAKTDEETKEATETTVKELEKVELSWYFVGNFPQVDQDLVFAEVNKMIEAKMNATVEFKPFGWGDYDSKMQVVISSGEDFDLCFTAPWINNYAQNVDKGAYAPLDDLLTMYAPNAYAAVPAAMWDATKINGKIYGFINQQISARTPELNLPLELAEKYNVDMDSLSGKLTTDTLGLLEPYLEAVKADYPEKAFYVEMGMAGMELFGIEAIQAWNVPGAVVIGDAGTIVQNQFESDTFKAYAQLMREWNTKGYLNSDKRVAMADGQHWVEAKVGRLAGIIGGAYKPGGKVEAEGLAGFALASVPAGVPYLSTGGIIATMHAIGRNSENPERAMMLLEYLNTDAEAYNTLNFGIKDTHFTLNADGFMSKDSEEAKAYNPSVPWMFATNFMAYIFEGLPATLWEDTKAINANATASYLLGFSFNSAVVDSEIAKCSAVVDEYNRGISLGLADEATYNEFLEKLKLAGSEKIVAEMQSQVDAWKASK